jgi:K+-transporting ATPase A subunit
MSVDLLAMTCIFAILMIAIGMLETLQSDTETINILTAWTQGTESQPIAYLNMLTATV